MTAKITKTNDTILPALHIFLGIFDSEVLQISWIRSRNLFLARLSSRLYHLIFLIFILSFCHAVVIRIQRTPPHLPVYRLADSSRPVAPHILGQANEPLSVKYEPLHLSAEAVAVFQGVHMAAFCFLKGGIRCAIGTFQCCQPRSYCFKRMKQLFQAYETTVSSV